MYSDGGTIDYTPVSQVYGGDVVVVGTIPMVATVDIAAGEQGALKYNDIFKLPKTSDAFTQGDAVYWNATGNPVGGTAGTGAADSTTGQLAGFAVADAASGDEYVICALTAAKRTTTIAGSVTADDITGSDSSLGISGQSAAQGGAILLTGGTSSTSGNAGGAITLTGGTPGATGVGGAVTITAGAGGSTSGAGGAVTIAAGAGTAGNANGGALTIRAGAKQGSGADGALSIGTTNTASITIGAASIETKIVGPENRTVGASTAAAGTTFADAGALPAGTAAVYPTTGADGTKGVIVNASDKVTGRMIFIGNGVSNQILKVYGPSGATINGASANVAFSGASGKGVIMYCLDSTANTWLAW
jgi:predicted RecA/RadA family phage recombinase